MQTTSSGRVLKIAGILALVLSASLQLRAATYYVNVNPSSFSPSTVNINVGDSVVWINQDDTFSHTVTSTTGAWTAGYLLNYQDTFGLTFNGTGTYSYYDQFDNFAGSVVVSSAQPPPSNDQCSGAIAMTFGTTYTMSTASATSTGDPAPSCGSTLAKGVWYKITPGSAGSVTVSTCGSSFDTIVGVYTGSCGSLTQLACNDDNGPSCATITASVTFTAAAATTYYVLAGGYSGATGNLSISASFVSSGPAWQEKAVAWDTGVMLAHPTSNLLYIVDKTNDRLLTLNTDTGTFTSSTRLVGKTATAGLMCFSTNRDLIYVPLNAAQKLQVIALSNMTTVDIVSLTIAPLAVAAGNDGMLYTMAVSPGLSSWFNINKIDPTTGQKIGTLNNLYYNPIIKANQSATRLYTMELGLSGGGSAVDEYSVVPGALPMYVTNHFTSESNDKEFVIAEDINWLYKTAGGVYGVGAWDMTARTYQYWPYNTPYGAAVAMVPGASVVYGASADSSARICAFDRLTGASVGVYDGYASGRPSGSINDRSLLVTTNGRIFYSRATRLLGLIGASSFTTNTPPILEPVDAGTNRTVFTADVFNLSAFATNASGADTFSWTKISGPGAVNFSAPSNTNTTAQMMVAGSYVLQVSRSNNVGISRDQVLVTVLSRPLVLDLGSLLNGQFVFGFGSDPGNYVVESTSDFLQWTTVSNVTSSSTHAGVADSVNGTRRFYRVRTP